MTSLYQLEPVDYLLIGHLTRDLTPDGERLGGTVAYSALMAAALGMRVGIVTSWGNEFKLEPYLGPITIINAPTASSTTFENRVTSSGRVQIVHEVAAPLDMHTIPESWLNAPIVHLAPIAQEVDPTLIRHFPNSMICVTPQGWLREWDQNGLVSRAEWPEASFVLERAAATVLSFEDMQRDEDRIAELVIASQVMAVTEGEQGARVYWNGDIRRIRAPKVKQADTVGAGDIFSAAFFIRYRQTKNPWEASRFATQLASLSVTRVGLDSIPTVEEIQSTMVEVL
jgi:sugar/nucleoside kinase (ribokinase family)